MDARALRMLEFPAIVERLVAAAASAPGRAQATALVPSPDPAEVARRQRLTGEAIGLLDVAEEPDLTGVTEIRPAVALAARGSALEAEALRAVAVAARCGLAARRALDGAEDVSELASIARRIDPGLGQLAEEIERAVEEDGSALREGASPSLRSLRRALRDDRVRLAERLRRLTRDPELQVHLQEDFVTERGGRPVLAVKASARGRVPGIVHDASASGQNALRRAARGRRGQQPASRGRVGRTGGGRAPPARALGARRRSRGSAPRARGGRRRDRSCTRLRCCLTPLARLPGDGPRRGATRRRQTPAARSCDDRADRPRARRSASPRDQRPQHRRQDRRAEDARPRGRAAPGGTAPARRRSSAADLRSSPGGHRRRAVDRDEPVHLLGTRPQPAGDSRRRNRPLARPARRGCRGHRSDRRRSSRPVAIDADCGTGAPDRRHEPLSGAEGMGERNGRSRQRCDRVRPGDARAALPRHARPTWNVARAPDRRAPRPPRGARRRRAWPDHARAAPRRPAPGRGRVGRAGGARRARRAEAQRASADQALRTAEERERELLAEIERVRASAQAERERAIEQAGRDLAQTRAELEQLRQEIRAARRLERERRRAAPPAATRAERDRDRRLGAASERAAQAQDALARIDGPVPAAAPLGEGDPVLAPTLGVRGTVAEIDGDQALVLGRSGQRVRVPLERLRPYPDAGVPWAPPEPAVSVRATAPVEAEGELDLRGRTAQDAREAVRAFVDAAALAGRVEVRIIHGRGTGAVRTAVRDELTRHPLVEGHASDSADGATVARLANG